MEQNGFRQKDLAHVIGSESRASEVLKSAASSDGPDDQGHPHRMVDPVGVSHRRRRTGRLIRIVVFGSGSRAVSIGCAASRAASASPASSAISRSATAVLWTPVACFTASNRSKNRPKSA